MENNASCLNYILGASYRSQSSGGVSGLGGPFYLEGVKEQDGDEVDLRQCRSTIEGECPQQVSTF
jgi:hypothetical protein